jgi:hypothetical protein
VRAAFQMKEATNCDGLFGQAASKGSRPNSIPSRVLQIGIEIRSTTKNNQTHPNNRYLDMGQCHEWNYFPIGRFKDRAMGPRGTSRPTKTVPAASPDALGPFF